MGGAGKAVRQAGRWVDSNVLQTTGGQIALAGMTGGMSLLPTLAYNALRPKGEGMPDLGAIPQGVDASDLVIRLARERERRRQMGGGTQSSFLAGVLGDTSPVSPVVKKMQGR